MNTVEPVNESSEGMSLTYLAGENTIYHAVYTTETFGTFVKIGDEWLALTPDDTSLENLSIMDISPKYYKTVIDLFDAAKSSGKHLKYEDVAPYEVVDSLINSDVVPEATLAGKPKVTFVEEDSKASETPDSIRKDKVDVIEVESHEDISKIREANKQTKIIDYGKDAEKIKFSDLPPNLKKLIRDMISRIEDKIGEEDAYVFMEQVRNFESGKDHYNLNEITRYLSRMLRILM